mmetsp:Transcript_4696/g.7646  ORF Transcript_4696/g.7646 Transcript_4696/m.7646 type:complete len:206 (+) Transcript_4696:100-717(+)
MAPCLCQLHHSTRYSQIAINRFFQIFTQNILYDICQLFIFTGALRFHVNILAAEHACKVFILFVTSFIHKGELAIVRWLFKLDLGCLVLSSKSPPKRIRSCQAIASLTIPLQPSSDIFDFCHGGLLRHLGPRLHHQDTLHFFLFLCKGERLRNSISTNSKDSNLFRISGGVYQIAKPFGIMWCASLGARRKSMARTIWSDDPRIR